MKYVFPCIISKSQNLYSLTFPDLGHRKIFGTDLYDILRTAHNVLMIELYLKEVQRIVIADATPIEKLPLEHGQSASYIICDTDIFGNTLDLYDNIQTDDLEEFLQKKEDESKSYEETFILSKQSEDEKNPDSKDTEHSDLNDMLDYEDSLEVVTKTKNEPIQTQNTKTNTLRPRPPKRYNSSRPAKKSN